MALTCNGNGEIAVADMIDEINLKADKAGGTFTGNIEVPGGATAKQVPNVEQNDATYLKLTGGNVDSLSISGKVVTGNNLSFKNLVVNGDFQVAQEHQSRLSSGTNIIHQNDLFWAWNKSGNKLWLDSTVYNSQGRRAYKITYSDVSTDKDVYPFNYSFEGLALHQYKNKKLTLSFRLKTSFTGKLSLGIAVGHNGSDKHILFGADSVANVEKRHSFTFTLYNADFPDDTSKAGRIYLCGSNYNGATETPGGVWSDTGGIVQGSINWAALAGTKVIEISDVQLEEGTKATEFEVLPYDVQLQRVQRYFAINSASGYGNLYAGLASGDHRGNSCFFPVKFRAIPTVKYNQTRSGWNCSSNGYFYIDAGQIATEKVSVDGAKPYAPPIFDAIADARL